MKFATGELMVSLQKKIGVLKIQQHAEIGQQTQNQQKPTHPLPRRVMHPPRQIKIDQNTRNEQHKIDAAGFVIKINGEQDNEDRPCPIGLRQQRVDAYKAKEQDQKQTAVKDHRALRLIK